MSRQRICSQCSYLCVFIPLVNLAVCFKGDILGYIDRKLRGDNVVSSDGIGGGGFVLQWLQFCNVSVILFGV